MENVCSNCPILYSQTTPDSSAPQLTRVKNVLDVLFRIQELFKAGFKSTKQVTMSSVSQVTLL